MILECRGLYWRWYTAVFDDTSIPLSLMVSICCGLNGTTMATVWVAHVMFLHVSIRLCSFKAMRRDMVMWLLVVRYQNIMFYTFFSPDLRRIHVITHSPVRPLLSKPTLQVNSMFGRRPFKRDWVGPISVTAFKMLYSIPLNHPKLGLSSCATLIKFQFQHK